MKVRIKFTKTGALKYIGHLDVMRYFQKLLKRAHIPVAYSEGFSPHPIMSLSPPLPLGAESLGEYADIEITELLSSEDAVNALNANSADEIKIQSFKLLPDKAPNAMAAVSAAEYICCFKDNVICPFDFKTEIEKFLSQDKIEVNKKTKKSEAVIDIKPLIYDYNFTENDKLFLRLSTGSTNNLKPELLYKALFEKNGCALIDNALNITRVDLLFKSGDELISLDDAGREIK